MTGVQTCALPICDEGEPSLDTASQVKVRWEEVKAQERGGKAKAETLLSGIPRALPALLRAYQIGARAHSVGFDWDTPTDVVAKIREEVEEVAEVVAGDTPLDHDRAEEEMGDLLFSVANLCRKLDIEPESALRKANEKFHARFTEMERRFEARGQSVHGATLEEMENEWGRIKSDG